MRIVLSVLVIFAMVIAVPAAFGQEFTIADKAKQESVEVTIAENGQVHVKHVVERADVPKQVELIDGIKSGFIVVDENGEEQQHGMVGENDAILIFPSDEDTTIEYDLGGALALEGDLWTWDFLYRESTTFIFPDKVDLIFANDRPVNIGDKRGMMCHGCQMILEYSVNEPRIIHNVKWEDREFVVEMRTHGEISNFVFDQPSKSIGFEVESDNDFVTTVIPLELLWEPYQVYLGDKKEFFHKYGNNGTHVWLNIRPDTSGEVTIIGATVIPEFPMVLLVLSLSIIAIIPLSRKFNLR